ncbi:biopolymer transporter ExbD [Alphaproteobacteria bacterium KMM 3653]|uniref:Biopolymer transporter ExbD n=1 Tax=Harenicola maris TaxID=2841044 RepID=A0AAP2G7V5_9RHOB|nr:biopolymer transporter ExbD [Harenicola maris]
MSITTSPLSDQRPPRRPDFGLAQVNIVLLLVLFFLVVGTIVETDELSVDLSKTEDLPLERLPRPLLLIAPDGTWALDGQAMSAAEVAEALSAPAAEGQPNAVYILAPQDLPADSLIAAMEALVPTGRAVSLVTLKDKGAAP